MKELGKYCTETHMFVEPPKDPDMNHLVFLRGLMERGRFGRPPASVPMGEHVRNLPFNIITKYAMQQANKDEGRQK